jgi:hypothetical protein
MEQQNQNNDIAAMKQIEQIIQQLASQIEACQIYLNLLQATAQMQPGNATNNKPTTSEPDPKNHLNLCSRQYAFDFRVRRSQMTRLATLLFRIRNRKK